MLSKQLNFVRSGYVNEYQYYGPEGYVFIKPFSNLGQAGYYWTLSIVENSHGAAVHYFYFNSAVSPSQSISWDSGAYLTGYSLRCLAS